MPAPIWFDRGIRFGNKLAQLQAAEPDAGWDANKLEAVFTALGYANTADGLYKHFLEYGNDENVSPSPWFVVDEYKAAKLKQLQADEPEKEWTVEKMDAAFM